mgnify:CR=1 FL=1
MYNRWNYGYQLIHSGDAFPGKEVEAEQILPARNSEGETEIALGVSLEMAEQLRRSGHLYLSGRRTRVNVSIPKAQSGKYFITNGTFVF